MRTLLLDSAFRPVGVIGWKRAIILMLTGRAETLESYHEIDIRSTRDSYKLPKTLRLFTIHRSRRTVKFSRFNVLFRDNFECQYCGSNGNARDLTLDHIIPLSKGGGSTWENVVAACHKCNGKKGSKLLDEIGMRLNRKPYRPKWTPQLVLKLKETDPKEWKFWIPQKKLTG